MDGNGATPRRAPPPSEDDDDDGRAGAMVAFGGEV